MTMIRTQEEVLEHLPPDVAADFNCVRGPHEWVSVSSAGRTWKFCKHCPAKRRSSEWDDTRHLYGYGLHG